MKSLLVLALAAMPIRHYSARGVEILPTTHPSCGGADRFLRDRFAITIYNGTATVNGTPWQIVSDDDDVVLSHSAEPGAFTSMNMLISGDTGVLELVGLTENRATCVDLIRLRVR